MYQNDDLRFKKTNQLLYNSIITKIQKNQKLNVTKICELANVSKVTFYHHFTSKNDLLKSLIKNQLYLKLPIPIKLKPRKIKHLIFYLINIMANYFNDNKLLLVSSFLYVNSNGLRNSYYQMLFEITTYYVVKEFKILFLKNGDILNDVVGIFVSFGIFGLLTQKLILNETINNSNIWNCLKNILNDI